LSELCISLKLIEMLGVNREKHAVIQQLENVIDGEPVDPGIQDARSTPRAALRAPTGYIPALLGSQHCLHIPTVGMR
jgi:hypothetical protein